MSMRTNCLKGWFFSPCGGCHSMFPSITYILCSFNHLGPKEMARLDCKAWNKYQVTDSQRVFPTVYCRTYCISISVFFMIIMKQVFSICFCPQGAPGDWNAIPLRHLFCIIWGESDRNTCEHCSGKKLTGGTYKTNFSNFHMIRKKHIYFLFNYWIFFRAPRCGGHNYTLKLHHLVLGRLRQSGTLAQSMSIISQSPLLRCQE